MTLQFRKMHGLGNDFVIVDNRDFSHAFTADQIRLIAHRHFGVGCDQFIVLEPSAKADVFMRIYNPDASEAGTCGNATRCVAHLLERSECTIETVSGILPCERQPDGQITVDMGAPRSIEDITVDSRAATAVDMGNPHCIFFVDDLNTVKVEAAGHLVEFHPQFPNRTNVEFVQILAPDKIRMRVWERGAGVTLACGSGACATIVAAASKKLSNRKAELLLDGGSLFLDWRDGDGHILMTGPAAYIFDGTLKAL
ncbi:MAG: diaminopimelate epimerase [Micavibrio sp.]|nr:diaminopimelate epimerase [Micavibrio sp.]